MKKLYLFMMVSLDGYFEGPAHDLSWHNAGNDEFLHFADEQTGAASTLLFGKRTFEMMADFWPKQGLQLEPTTAKIMNEKPKVVVTDSDFAPEWNNTRVINATVADLKEEILKLKEGEGSDIALLGSNMLCVSLMELGLVDEFRIMVNPVAIGSGTPLFKGLTKKFNMRLMGSHRFENGNVLLTYIPAK